MNPEVNGNVPRLGGQHELVEREGKSQFSQRAEIGGKQVTITLNFGGQVTLEQAQAAMAQNLAKVAALAAAFHLGQAKEGDITHALTLDKEGALTRTYASEGDKGVELKDPGHLQGMKTREYSKEEVSAKLEEIQKKTEEIRAGSDLGTPTSGGVKEVPSQIPPPIATPTSLSSRENSPADIGKVFEDQFNVKGVVIKEKAVRAETVATIIKSLETKISRLKAKIEVKEKESGKLEVDEKGVVVDKEKAAELAALNKHLTKAQSDLASYKEHTAGATHGSTNMPRFVFKALGRKSAKELMPPILYNLRMHTVEKKSAEASEVVSAVTRSGAISDFRFGEVSLQELKDFRALETFDVLSSERRQELKDLYIREEADDPGAIQSLALLIKTKALVGYGADALVVDPSQTQSLERLLEKIQKAKRIEDAFKELTPEEKELLGGVAIDEVKLEEVIHERRDRLKLLVLQDLQLHLKTTKASRDPILYGRTCLVDLQKKASKESECVIHERTQGLDMKAIFDELEGKTVHFDCKGSEEAYIDEEGAIHMPEECALEGVPDAKLNTVFFNICVQGAKGHVVNDGMQKCINDATLNKLRGEYGETKEFKALETSLNELSESESHDPNDSVLLVTKFLQNMKGYSGINCYGGKDRTGYALALITYSHAGDERRVDPSDPELKKVGPHLLRSDGIAAKIAHDNADHTVLKLSRWDLSLYNMDTLKGKMLRAAHACSGLWKEVKKAIKKRVGLPTLEISATPRQVYDPHAEKTKQKVQEISHRFRSNQESYSKGF